MSMVDIAIVGSGPAGISAALNAKIRNKSFYLFGTAALSDKVRRSECISNYPGVANVGGMDLHKMFADQLSGAGIEITEKRITGIYNMGKYFSLLADQEEFQAKTVILATGVETVRPIPGERELLGRGVSYCATCDGMLYRGRRVAVLGWTPSARKEADFLEEIGCQVVYFDRPRDCSIQGGETVEAVTCGGVTEAVEGVFLLRPAMAPGELFPGLASEGGYVTVNRNMETNLPGVFAAGDCTGKPLQASKAVGEGLIAGQGAAAFAVALK